MMIFSFVQIFTTVILIFIMSNFLSNSIGNFAYSLLPDEADAVNRHIKHFIVIIQGRHTFDNYFGTFPGADGFPKNTSVPLDPFEPNQSTYAKPFHINGEVNYKARDDPPTYRLSYNNGNMNGFILAQKNNTGNPINVMGYFDNRDIPYYWKFASEYVLAQRFFSPSMRSDLVNSLYAIDANPSLKLQDVPIQGLEINRTIFDSLEAKNIPWRVYVENLGHIYEMNKEDTLILKRSIPILAIPRFTDNQSLKSNISDLSDYFDDILSNKLANVSFLYFTGSNDSPTTNVIPSQELVANLVYALMRSQYWNSSAILITHNEAGGWYDHVKPPINNNTAELSGFRVPAIIISPYVKSAHFDSNTYDIKAFLDIIQSSFGINNTINSINNTNRMYSVFDFAQKPRQPPLLQEIPSERVTINPEQIKGINIIYVMSLSAPVIATFCWYYIVRKSK